MNPMLLASGMCYTTSELPQGCQEHQDNDMENSLVGGLMLEGSNNPADGDVIRKNAQARYVSALFRT
jgi:hypothetical protein